MELDVRKQAVLKAIVELYIRTNEPVGSKAVAQWMDQAVSSATIRNEMAELCSLGFLEQPHTSAGRVPTRAAFRLYIDRLMQHCDLDDQSKKEIDEVLNRCMGDPDRLISTVTQTLADDTGYAVVTTTPSEQDTGLRQLELIRLSGRSAALLLMTSSGVLRSRVCRFEREVSEERLTEVMSRLNERYAGGSLSKVDRAGVQRLLLSLGEDGLLYAPLLTTFYELAAESAEAELLLGGQLNLLKQPDYAPDTARSLLSFLSEREQLGRLMAACSGGLRVLLGGELPRPELSDTSIIVTSYHAGEAGGSLGLIGPLRMNYELTIPRIEYFARSLGRLLGELWNEG